MLDLYREQILDHYKNPRNFGKLKNPDYKATLDNPLCGDRLTFYLKFVSGKVAAAKFEGEGCALSRASASLLTEKIKDWSPKQLRGLKSRDILKMLGVKISPGRLKCALLPLEALRRSLKRD